MDHQPHLYLNHLHLYHLHNHYTSPKTDNTSLQPIVLPKQPIQPVPKPQLNWSHFKPEFADKLDEHVEAHHLRTYDWMDTYALPEGVKVQCFYLTLVGETRLWC